MSLPETGPQPSPPPPRSGGVQREGPLGARGEAGVGAVGGRAGAE